MTHGPGARRVAPTHAVRLALEEHAETRPDGQGAAFGTILARSQLHCPTLGPDYLRRVLAGPRGRDWVEQLELDHWRLKVSTTRALGRLARASRRDGGK